jgi:ubiquinone/menaquinone biosynthesis C-methylase UbiE
MRESEAEFDEYAGNYADTVNAALNSTGMRVEHFVLGKACHIDLFFKKVELKRNDPVLDLGCGVGQYEQLLGQQYSITGIDMSAASIDTAKTYAMHSDFLSYDGDILPFADSSFRCVFTICVVHHVPLDKRSQFISEVYRVLKPGGYFMVYEHNPWNPLTRRIVEKCVFDKDAILLSSNYAKDWLSDQGFEEVFTDFLFTLPPINQALAKTDNLFKKLPTGAQYATIGMKPL